MRSVRNSVLALVLGIGVQTASGAVLTIQPIQVCDDGGANCGNSSQTLFELAGDKIWAQAGIDLFFLPWTMVNETDYLVIDNSADLNGVWGTGANPSATVVSMYFVNQILFCGVAGSAYGCGATPGNRTLIADNVFTFNGGIGRIDTIAHELGHNLGLPHLASNAADHLMTTGGSRSIPGGLGDITPDGLGLDKLSPDEIAIAISSDLLVPEPATILLTLAGLAVVMMKLKRENC